MANAFKVNIFKKQFRSKETEFLTFGEMTVSCFLYPSGVQALRIKNKRGESL